MHIIYRSMGASRSKPTVIIDFERIDVGDIGDRAQLLDMMSQGFMTEFDAMREEYVKSLERNPDSLHFILHQGRRIGTLDIPACVDPQYKYVQSFTIIPEYRRRGYARQTLLTLLQQHDLKIVNPREDLKNTLYKHSRITYANFKPATPQDQRTNGT